MKNAAKQPKTPKTPKIITKFTLIYSQKSFIKGVTSAPNNPRALAKPTPKLLIDVGYSSYIHIIINENEKDMTNLAETA